ncbi:MAG: GAF domain-containing protein [Thermodesulfobacteriota bacterium]
MIKRLKLFLSIFLPWATVLLVFSVYFFFTEIEKTEQVRMEGELLNVNLGKQAVSQEFKGIVSDLLVLSRHRAFSTTDTALSGESMAWLSHDFRVFAESKKLYDQVRFLDPSGVEVIRVNYNRDGTAAVVSDEFLQDKGESYYFRGSVGLAEDSVYVSPLDLNIEHGQIEKPFKPMIRFGTPVINEDGKKIGVFFLNYLAERLLANLHKAMINVHDHASLVNRDGFWLHHRDPEKEWGFLLDHGQSVAREEPEVWQRIKGEESGQFVNRTGLFTFIAIHPLQIAREIYMGSEHGVSLPTEQDYRWTIISHVSRSTLERERGTLLLTLLKLTGPALALLALISWYLSLARMKNRESDEQLKKDALKTQVLLDLHKNVAALQGRELYHYVLDKAVELTDSRVGYLHEVEGAGGDSTINLIEWNRETVENCTATCDTHYPLAEAGIWADSVRLQKPVIHNDYQNSPAKKGYPEGHVNIVRHLSIPVIGDGKVTLVIGVGNKETDYCDNDIFQIQLIANELQDILSQRRVAEVKSQLELRLKQAQKMEAIGLMAGGVAHDLNNILSGIVGYPEILLNGLSEKDSLRQPIEAIHQSGKRAAAVVEDLLTVARGVATIQESYDLHLLIEEYLESPEYLKVKSLYPEVGCQCTFQAESSSVICSPIHIKKCIMNLVTNAMEAVGEQGSVSLFSKNQYVDERLSKNLDIEKGLCIVIGIRDNGPGIASSALDQIFEPFYTKKAMGRSGTGLGLTVVWNSMEDHQGKITVESNEKGTLFQLYFPVNSEQSSTAANNRVDCEIEGGNEKILVVDDEPELRDIASKMLELLGYQVDSVGSGEMALEFLRERPVDLIMLDMIMKPGWSGFQTYREVIKLYPEQNALIASGFSENEDVKATIHLGAGGFIKKPYSLEQLGRAVKEVLQD